MHPPPGSHRVPVHLRGRQSTTTKPASRGIATQDPTVVATLEEALARSWTGTTPDAFEAEVRNWVATVKQPKFGVGYTELVYQPMLEPERDVRPRR
jgi:hypothetical protein